MFGMPKLYLRRRIATNKNAAKPAINAYVDGSGTIVNDDTSTFTLEPIPPVLITIFCTSVRSIEEVPNDELINVVSAKFSPVMIS